MVQEFNGFQQCGTWKLVPYHPQMNLLPNKWVFKIKKRADGSVERHKARFVANGFHLKPGNSSQQMAHLIKKLGTLFSMKDLGPLNYFLGVEVKYVDDQMHLSQAKYALDLLQHTKFLDAKPISTRVPCGHKLSAYDGEPYDSPDLYRSVVGALKCLTITRPDLSSAVNQAMYNHGLLYKPGTTHLMAFLNADYTGNPDTWHSTGGFCIYLGSNLVSWSSKKQKTVSRSSSEAEYWQLAYIAAELSWLRSLFRNLHLHLICPTIWCDNISSIALASNPVFHSRTKHLEVDYHYVCEKVVRGQLVVNYICSQDQIADLFTEELSSTQFKLLVSKLTVVSPPVSLWGDVRPSHSLRASSRVCDQVEVLSNKS
ncbi:uncharacterized mitochondrial protein AtMg00810-like [Malus sylvestris]|uniref:uncharacterized mitochondrial protein AtMg00810-like n=1 Tax=Malus sylvestris TaxID=3752 RepID=UPI0021ACD3C2|nr:uncharacterized mitochondrial protein AtMg00810-like [Malus sylvestris]